jgi:hypothetical protein
MKGPFLASNAISEVKNSVFLHLQAIFQLIFSEENTPQRDFPIDFYQKNVKKRQKTPFFEPARKTCINPQNPKNGVFGHF